MTGMWYVNGKFEKSNFFVYLFCGWEDRALQECNLSAPPPVDCSNSIPPGLGFPNRVFSFRKHLQATDFNAQNSS